MGKTSMESPTRSKPQFFFSVNDARSTKIMHKPRKMLCGAELFRSIEIRVVFVVKIPADFGGL
jgi:hypothetical protein